MKALVGFGLIAASAVAMSAGSALAHQKAADQAAAEVATDDRVILLEDLGYLMDARLGPMVRNAASFDAAAAKATAGEMAELAAQIPAAFAIDTRGFRLATNARDNIWESHDDFLDRSRALDAALADLQALSDGAEHRVAARAILQVGQACSACHDAYKND